MALMDAQYPTGKDYDDESDALNEHWEEPGDPDGVVAAEKLRRQMQNHPAPPHSPDVTYNPDRNWPKPKLPKVHVPVKPLLIAVLIVAAVGTAYWLGTRSAGKQDVQATQTTQQTQTQADPAPGPLQHYDSTTFALGLDHPSNWTVADTPTKLTVTSPLLHMTDLAGPTTGHVVLTVQNQQTSIPGYPTIDAMANLVSQQLTYSNPSSVQRGQTYLSYVAYKSPNGIDALYLTGDTAYKVGQHVPMSDIVAGNPLVSVTFKKCSANDCSKGSVKPMTLLAKSWKTAEFRPTVINLLQSLTFN